jgi:type II secretory ATPase GspE/PulE/Tfp pilus assembly ATPase PilB-like protein
MEGEQYLSTFLLDTGLLSRGQLSVALTRAQEKRETLAQALVHSGVMDEDAVRVAIGKSAHIPLVQLEAYDFTGDALAAIPEPFCRSHGLVCFKKEDSILCVALLDLATLEELRTLGLPYELRVHLTDRATIKKGLLRYQKLLKEQHEGTILQRSSVVVAPASDSPEDLSYSAERLAVEQMLFALLRHALSQRASAIHLEPRDATLHVRYRIGGSLYDALALPVHTVESLFARIKLLAKMPLNQSAGEGRFKVELGDERTPEELSVRASAFPASRKMVLHISPKHYLRSNFTLESLGMHGESLDLAHKALHAKEGLIVVYGPAHSGKTTMLYTLADMVADPRRSVVSVEERIEWNLPGIVQTQASAEEGITVSGRLRSALSTDPDVLVVGACKEASVAVPMVHAANRGKLVIASIEAATCEAALQQLLSLDVPARLLSSTFLAAIGVGVARRLCTKHSEEKLARGTVQTLEDNGARPSKILDTLKEEECVEQSLQWKDLTFGTPEPCPECEDGFQGMVGLQEVVPASLMLRRAIEDDEEGRISEVALATMPLSKLEDGVFKAAQGQTCVEETFKATV